MNLDAHLLTLLGLIALALHLLGFLSAIQAVMTARTPQGSSAWALFLVGFPYVSLPLYWVFGRGRFFGYTVWRRHKDIKVRFLRKHEGMDFSCVPEKLDRHSTQIFESLAQMRFSKGNEARLLIDAAVTYEAILKAIDSAKEYLLVQFYIVREDDSIGLAFKKKLIEAAARGVRVYFLYDAIGLRLSKKYLQEMKEASVDIRPFRNLKGPKNRFQLNFRNHRKTVVVDGKQAFVGGINIGDDYLGKYPEVGYWRDTHLALNGPVVFQIQVAFMEDWYWSSDVLPIVKWEMPELQNPGVDALALPSGPADTLESYTLYVLQVIHTAKQRIWIATPYFIPDIQIISALQLATLRGVDVRILLPLKNDNRLCRLAHYSYFKHTLPFNIQISFYEKGFMHQKVILVDDTFSSIGTANFDNRSFRLNFESTVLIANEAFNKQVEAMLLEDFKNSKLARIQDLEERSFFFKLAVQVSRLFAPVL